MWWKRYEPILEAKPRPAKDVLLDKLAEELVELTRTFPPRADQIAWEDERLRQRFEPQMHRMPRVDDEMAAVLAQVLTWDLQHEAEAVDHFFRNQHYADACPTELHVEALHFLWRMFMEQLLARQEELEGTLKRRDLVVVVERYGRKLGALPEPAEA